MAGKSVVLKVAMAKYQSEAGYGRARLDSQSRSALGVELGDAVEITGKRTTVAKVFKSDPEDAGRGLIFIDGLTRTNAGAGVDESVTVRRCAPQPATQVVLAPNIEEGRELKFPDGIESVFLKGLLFRPLLAGSDVVVPNVSLMGNRSTFSVVQTVPKGPVVVVEGTEVVVRAKGGQKAGSPGVTYDDVGGLDDELRRIREIVELPLKHPELFERLGIAAPKGVLLYGPPGTGKTLLAEAVANESGAAFYSVRGPEIMGKYFGESEGALRKIFEDAGENAPSIIFLDEIDSIAPKRDDSYDGMVRLVAQLLTLMDGMGSRDGVIVIGATNREDSVDPALRRPGRFDREIEIGIPSRKGRADILAVHLKGMPLDDDVDADDLAARTLGFVGADLAALCREAAMHCLSSRMGEIDLDRPIPPEVLESMRVSREDFEAALGEVEPSGMREVLVEIPKVTWDDVGGLDDVRRRIEEVFVPEEGNAAYDRLGIRAGKGILLYGPPGTGKTLIAKAVANGAGANFIAVNGPEVASKWYGETERAIRQVFKRAKQMAPCIVFFDEIDSIAPVRGGDDEVSERVVAQLLASMDGVEGLRNVTVMAATNRPDMVDPALLRPGRFDSKVLVGKPDAEARLRILQIHARDMPLDGVDLADVAGRTDGYVGADLEAVCREAGLAAYREDPGADRVLPRHFEAALAEVGPSVTPEIEKSYEAAGKKLNNRRGGWDSLPFYGRPQVLRHVRRVERVSESAVVPAGARRADHADAVPAGLRRQALGLRHQAPPEPAVLPFASVSHRRGAAQHLQLAHRRLRVGVHPQAHVADHAVPALERHEVLHAPGRLVGQVLQDRRVGVDLPGAADLPAPDAPAPGPLGLHPGGHELADVALGYAGGDLGRRDVPLDPQDADVLGHLGLHLREEPDGVLLVVGPVLPGPPHVVHARALHHQQGVELEHVRAVRRVAEHLPEALQVVPRVGAREPGHQVVAHLHAHVLAVPGAPADLLHPVPAVHARQHGVVEYLHPELRAREAHGHRAGDLLRAEHVRAGLHSHPDAPPRGRPVELLRMCQRVGVLPVEGVEAPPDEPLLVRRVAARERPAHDDQVYLVGPVADLLQLGDAVSDLPPGVEPVQARPPRGRLLARVRLRRAVRDPSGAVRAPAVGAVVRRRHHSHRGHAARGPRRLLEQQREGLLAGRPLRERQYERVRGHLRQPVLLAEGELEVLQGRPVADLPGGHGLQDLPRQKLGGVGHTAPGLPWSPWAPRGPARARPPSPSPTRRRTTCRSPSRGRSRRRCRSSPPPCTSPRPTPSRSCRRGT